jgi:hypothetical protein
MASPGPACRRTAVSSFAGDAPLRLDSAFQDLINIACRLLCMTASLGRTTPTGLGKLAMGAHHRQAVFGGERGHTVTIVQEDTISTPLRL